MTYNLEVKELESRKTRDLNGGMMTGMTCPCLFYVLSPPLLGFLKKKIGLAVSISPMKREREATYIF